MPENVKLIQRELQYRKDLLSQYEKLVRSAPEGYLRVRKYSSGKQGRFHCKKDAHTGKVKRRMLDDSDQELIAELKLKAFATACIPVLKKSIKMTENCLAAQAVFDPKKIEQQMGEGYQGVFLELQMLAKAPESEAWQAVRENKNPRFPEKLRYETADGRYRSKSEMVIAMQLARFEINFKYEPVINLGSMHYAPDFVIMNPLDGGIVYWEHLGLLDKEEYRSATERKLAVYYANGIRPGDNLILSCDSESAPLSALQIERVIKANFL
jgi:hypothetical protein